MDFSDIYTELILEESRSKRNRRELDHPTKSELGHNPSCGDEITLQIEMKDGKIADIAYTGHGCAISQAATSIMCDTVKGMTKEEAKTLCDKFIDMIKGELASEEELEELGDAAVFENIKNVPARVKCAVLSWYTLKSMLEE